MGHGIDSRAASRRSGRRSGWHQPSTDLRTLFTEMRWWIEAFQWKAYGGWVPRSEGRVALEGRMRLEEMARGTGKAGSP